MRITSQNIGQKIGSVVLVEGGKTISINPIGGVSGTVVQVNDLFYNTPARLKFLKRDLTEKQQIDGLVTRYSLAYPDKAIHLDHDGKTVLQTTGNGNRREILAQLYGVDLARQLLEVIFEEGKSTITGFISPISVNRSNRKDITFFVNGRWVQDTALISALLKAYQTYLMVGRYPLSILFIEIDPEDVDVNVHPAKSEVRFKKPDEIFSSVQRAVRRALMAYSPVPQIAPTPWRSEPWFSTSGMDTETKISASTPEGLSQQPEAENERVTDANGEQAQLVSGIPLLRLIGQIGATYLVAEGPDGLYLIDQHAAHERVLFEKMSRQKGKIATQALLEPELIQMPPQSASILEENLRLLNEIGFELEEFGQNTFRLSAMPAIFGQRDPRAAISSVVEDFEEDETPLTGLIEEKMIARICKRMAIKGGSVLSVEEQNELMRSLEACASPRTCPHGRPTMIHLSVELLERQFGRRGARSS